MTAHSRDDTDAPQLARALFLAIVLLFPIADLAMATLHARTGSAQVELIRYFRDLATAALGLIGLVTARLPAGVYFAALLYSGFVAVYSSVALITNLPIGVVVESAGTLMLPVLLTAAAAYSVRRVEQLTRLVHIVVFYGLASALFGFWDVHHTEFWTKIVDLGGYLREVKKISTGYDPQYQLPWNFQGFGGARRAAGLLAAPLAQGSFLSIAAIVSLAAVGRSRVVFAIAGSLLCIVGIYQSGTRGAIVMTAVSLVAFVTLSSRGVWSVGKTAILVAVVAAFYVASASMLEYTIDEKDGSTAGHVEALHKNIGDLSQVLLLGDGMGAAGSVPADIGLSVAGGGEGALFTIAYQIGVPGAVIFLAFYVLLSRALWRSSHAAGTQQAIYRALVSALIGVSTSFISSEHIFTYSGMASLWLLAGAATGTQPALARLAEGEHAEAVQELDAGAPLSKPLSSGAAR
jgi:hypothetical protein